MQIVRFAIDPAGSEANRRGKVVAAPLADLVASAPPPETAQVPPPTEPALTGDAQRAVPGRVAAKLAETPEVGRAIPVGEQAPDRTRAASEPSPGTALEPSPSPAPEPSSRPASDAAALEQRCQRLGLQSRHSCRV